MNPVTDHSPGENGKQRLTMMFGANESPIDDASHSAFNMDSQMKLSVIQDASEQHIKVEEFAGRQLPSKVLQLN